MEEHSLHHGLLRWLFGSHQRVPPKLPRERDVWLADIIAGFRLDRSGHTLQLKQNLGWTQK
jgi:hypothetical protein